MARGLGETITPVCYIDTFRALDSSPGRFPLIPLYGESLDVLAAMAKQGLRRLVPESHRALFNDPVLLSNDQTTAPSIRDKVAEIRKRAKNAAFIALQTHSRRGVKRFLMGSFAESFLLESGIPTLIINPVANVSGRIKRIVFPTDFSNESLLALDHVADLAVRLQARISIVHYLHLSRGSGFLTGVLAADAERSDRALRSELSQKGKRLVARLQGRKVNATFVLLTGEGAFDPSGALIDYSSRPGIDMIALAARSGALRSTMVGATSREIARGAMCPVLILRFAG